jgi:hypothetical protein
MQPWLMALLVLLFTTPQPAQGYESGSVRSLQLGPIGDGAGFNQHATSEAEGSLGFRSIESTVKKDTDKETTQHTVIQGGMAAGLVLSPEVQFVIDLKETSNQYPGLSHSNNGFPGTKQSEIKAGPIYRGGQFLIGGAVGAAYFSGLKYKPEDHPVDSVEVDGTLFPTAQGFAGVILDRMQLTLGLRVYNGKTSTAKYEDVDSTQKDIVRSVPGEGRLDAQFRVSEALRLGLSWTYVVGEPGNNSLDANDGLKSIFPDEKNYLLLDAGGVFHVNRTTTLVGGFHYFQPAYDDDFDASLFKENLGGYRFDIGTHHWLMYAKVFFNLAYHLPAKTKAKVKAYEANTDTFEDQEYELEQSSWDMAIGATILI